MKRHFGLVPLSHQHHNALALCVLTERALAGTSPDLARLTERIVDRFDLEMVNHFQLEEEILFPPLAALPELASLVAELIAEHRQFADTVAAFRRAAASPDELTRFARQLRSHVRTEENVLFERAQTLLPEDTLKQMGEQFEQRAVRICLE